HRSPAAGTLLSGHADQASRSKYFNPPHYQVDIPEFKDNHGVSGNDLYDSAPADEEEVEDSFKGVRVRWSHKSQRAGGNGNKEKRSYVLKLAKADKMFLSAYFNHVTKRAAEFVTATKDLTLYTNAEDACYDYGWTGIPFKHFPTFASLALDPPLKRRILMDLDRFKQGRDFYSRIGRSWKRGYLLHGPPGTGKSSLIAAIANYMKYDMYDLELTRVKDNTELRALLTQTKEKSVIIIEDIDGSLDVTDRRISKPPQTEDSRDQEEENRSKVTLSGLLNFTDGLWSCCGEERIIVFTTNHKEMLDPALLRSGRMDMHILLSFCTFPQFKCLAFNYLKIEDHPLFPAVEEKMVCGAQMTPAHIIELFMNEVDDPDEALNDVISAIDAALDTSQSDEEKESHGHEKLLKQNREEEGAEESHAR
ncbi:hypothetical protein KI387_026368, partial [Taxus chinensis]